MVAYMTDAQAKAQIIEIGRQMYTKNFVAANDGNISCRVAEDIIWCTPTGVSKGELSENILLKMDLSGKVLVEGELAPSSEVMMHLRVYNENPQVNGVVHAHPMAATAFAIAGIPLDSAVYPEALVNLGTVPVARYATPSSREVPDSVAPFCRDYNALLLANHGALAWGRTLKEAWYRLEAMEHFAQILMYTSHMIGKTNTLSCKQVADLIKIREAMGITGGGVPNCAVCPSNTCDVISSGDTAQSLRPYTKTDAYDEDMLVDCVAERVVQAMRGTGNLRGK